MNNVTLSIAGRDYTVACSPGEEAHVATLGALINEKLRSLPAALASSESRSLLFAALLLADELQESRQASPTRDNAATNLARGLEAIATRLENIATHLEQGDKRA